MGLPECQIKKLQRIQNMAAKIVLNKRKYDSSTECMRYLHWLPIRQRVKYKALTIIYKRVVSKTSPVYLQEMFKIKASIQHLKSAASLYHLDVPKTHRKTFAARSSVSGAEWWNSLPENIKTVPVYDRFKVKLKTYLFEQYYA